MIPRLAKSEFVGDLTLEQLHEKMVAHGEYCFSMKGEAPFLWMIWDGSHLLWIETLWEDDREKAISVEFIKRLLRVSNARMYSFMSEMWMKSLTKEEAKGYDRAKDRRSVSEMPGRDDVLMIYSHSIDGGFIGTRYKVTIRRPIGPNFLGPRDDETMRSYAHAEGRVFDLFKQMGMGVPA
jgi:hypothetical protein